MDAFVIEGGRRLEGRLRVNGSKNAALPLLACPLLTDEPVVLRDVPDLADIRNMLGLLGELGVKTDAEPTPGADGQTVHLRVTDPTASHARYEIVRTMRASICALGPLVAKRGYARISMPGGCAIGDRPVDLHLRGLGALGASISLDSGDIVARAPAAGLRGATIFLGGPFGSTVLGTANVMCAATLAKGTTIIESAACEPEVVDVARLLTAMGARIEGAGSPRVIVHGVDALRGADHTVIPDRIEAGTLMCAAAITNGDVTLENCPIDTLIAAVDRLAAAGVSVKPAGGGALFAGPGDRFRAGVRITAGRYLAPIELTSQPHPGFPTDLQAQFMALLTLAEGNSVVTEKIFPDRFLHVAELARMGAKTFRQGPTVVVSGVRRLKGAPVMASDLRASASLVIAGLAAEGTTTVNRVYHLDRGYQRFEERLNALGARVERVDDKLLAPGQLAGAER
jgi:UDP-N-acetylglucosamine 1-carboxyvinyltransferase